MTLRNGRVVTVSHRGTVTGPEIRRLSRAAGLEREQQRLLLNSAAAREPVGGGREADWYLARTETGTLSGLFVFLAGEDREAEFCGAVKPKLRDLGLGTALLRQLAHGAQSQGMDSLRIDIPISNRDAAMGLLRDCGLRTKWDLGDPLRVTLDLCGWRPGWATPDYRPRRHLDRGLRADRRRTRR